MEYEKSERNPNNVFRTKKLGRLSTKVASRRNGTFNLPKVFAEHSAEHSTEAPHHSSVYYSKYNH
jgi:hypothetical protein